ncbi:acetyl esterase/lipase [Nocardia tenerifensis]|uniref:Acetyl esterase/lipase n=1 Tax=Nocardia tenerifensis TaxID=228006 RepID=A0A318K846_9NOCA|nr:alpha/beta hydrolase [Nocardia tenerifensis]PXX69285.1 acetyl esterase/lipase [Nocardia tenerifensis]
MSGHESVEDREEAALDRLLRQGADAGVVTSYGPHADQVLEVFGASGPTVVYLHGGYFRPTIDRTHGRPFARAAAATGVRVVLPEYRREPGNPYAAMEDLDLLEGFLAEPVLWVGHSAGGMLALTRAYRRSAVVLALAPVADLALASRLGLGGGAVTAWMGGTPEQQAARYADLDPRVRLAPRRPGVLLVHGSDDRTVPVSMSQDSPAESVVLPGAHHFDLIDPESEKWPGVMELMRAALPGRSDAP